MISGQGEVSAQNYTPPPLFGQVTQTVVKSNSDESNHEFVVRQAEIPSHVHDTTKIDLKNNLSLDQAASVVERVENPILDQAPMNVDLLLEHPANRVAENARVLIVSTTNPVASQTKSGQKKTSTIPDFLPYDTTPTTSVSGFSKDGQKVPPPLPVKNRAVMKPRIEKVTNQIPQVAVYSPDQKNGGFKRIESNDNHQENVSGTTTTYIARSQIVPGRQKDQKPNTILTPPIEDRFERNLDHPDLAPIALDDLQGDILAIQDTSEETRASPLPINQKSSSVSTLKDATEVKKGHIIVPFDQSQIDLNAEQKDQINANVVAVFQKKPDQMLEIRSYAKSTTDNPQRLALARGLAVREYLKDQGVSVDQMMIRALVAKNPVDDFDRVDVVFQ